MISGEVKSTKITGGEAKTSISTALPHSTADAGPEHRRERLLAQIFDLHTVNEQHAAESDAMLDHATQLIENNKLVEAERLIIAAEISIPDRAQIFRLNHLLKLCER